VVAVTTKALGLLLATATATGDTTTKALGPLDGSRPDILPSVG